MDIDLGKFRKRRYRGNYYIHFDNNYSLRRHFEHKTNTKFFPNHKNVLLFLAQNPSVNIYFTLNKKIKTFLKVDDGFLINMQAYTNFCKTVNNSDAGKIIAFLGQNLGINDINISDEETKDFIDRNINETNFLEIFKRFDSEAQKRLLNQIYLTPKQGKTTQAELTSILDRVASVEKEQLEQALNKSQAQTKVLTIVKTLSQAELKNVSGTYKHDLYKSELEKLERLLALEESKNIVAEIKKHADLIKYDASQPEKIFQNWIEQNLWIFGIEYVKKYDARKIGMFSEGDLLMESMDGYLDLIELKRPKLAADLFIYDKSHACYFPSRDLSSAIGQSMYYLQTLEDYKMNVEKEHKAQVIMPRVKIIAGRSSHFNLKQFAALRVLNTNLNRVQLVTYDYLLSCGKQIIKSYDE